MTLVTLIAACDTHGCIGKDNKLPWRCPSEMEYFLRRIAFATLIMGKNTCLSLKRPMNTGLNYVLTSDTTFVREGFITVNSFNELVGIIKNSEIPHHVVGGASLYNQFLDLAEVDPDIKVMVELSVLHLTVEDGDSFFPIDKLKGYNSTLIQSHSDNNIKWHAKAYIKK